jgi:serine/threonine-protein kinase HipA
MANVDVYVQSENVGLLAKTAQADEFSEKHSFTYLADAKQALSLLMPVRIETYDYSGLHPIFQMNLPEGYLREYLERATAKAFGSDDLTVLTLLGNNQIGRLQYRLEGQVFDDATEVAPELSEILSSNDEGLFDQLLKRFALRSGVAGVQPKMLLDASYITEVSIDNPSDKSTVNLNSYVVKTWGGEFPHLACNEYVCLMLCKNAGLDVPDFYISDNGKLFISKRFDMDSDGSALGFEDFCVLQAKSTKQKYDASLESCANTIKQYVSPQFLSQALADFFKLTVINVLVRNGDGHLKNSGIIYDDLKGYQQGTLPDKIRQLAPIFDVVSTVVYIKNDSMALTLTGSKRWPKWKVLEQFAIAHCGLSKKKAALILADVYQGAGETLPILEDLKKQHEGFAELADELECLLMATIG